MGGGRGRGRQVLFTLAAASSPINEYADLLCESLRYIWLNIFIVVIADKVQYVQYMHEKKL